MTDPTTVLHHGPGRLRTAVAAALVLLLAVATTTLWAVGRSQPTAAAWTDVVQAQGQVSIASVAGGTVTDVVAGDSFSCALVGGQVWCTGDNSVGQLGTGDTASTDVFVGPVRGELQGKTVTKVDAGTAHVCATTDDAVYCWGLNDRGQLGVEGVPSSTLPVRVPTHGHEASVTDLEVGASSSCVVADDKAYCWGGTHTQLGSTGTPVQINGGALPETATVTDVAVGDDSACLVADGVPYCWGANARGQLGDGTTSTSHLPVQVVTTGVLAGFTSHDVAVGNQFACVVASGANSAERTFCWGDNSSKQLGQSSNGAQVDLSTTPLQVRGALSELRSGLVAVGGKTACVLAYDGAAYCWGDNSSAQTGANQDEWTVPAVRDRPERVLTRQMSADSVLQRVDVSTDHGCTLTTGGNVYCWGANTKGQLGIQGTAGTAGRKVFPWPVTPTWSAWR
ncbi:hypothetical protein H9623_15405 [Oerskovia sp. Sa1BUA8]|uniref:Alpha-tubulin suppressor n=1 Tax=Oerskovia douganii TaxID=2762210 RepID=A0A9D5Z0Z8_9CELL|nr:RCC1 domain-containing protein [Oerskovia douganii]MBE7701679.1 hypothetical protein [Oerskovia douganii]